MSVQPEYNNMRSSGSSSSRIGSIVSMFEHISAENKQSNQQLSKRGTLLSARSLKQETTATPRPGSNSSSSNQMQVPPAAIAPITAPAAHSGLRKTNSSAIVAQSSETPLMSLVGQVSDPIRRRVQTLFNNAATKNISSSSGTIYFDPQLGTPRQQQQLNNNKSGTLESHCSPPISNSNSSFQQLSHKQQQLSHKQQQLSQREGETNSLILATVDPRSIDSPLLSKEHVSSSSSTLSSSDSHCDMYNGDENHHSSNSNSMEQEAHVQQVSPLIEQVQQASLLKVQAQQLSPLITKVQGTTITGIPPLHERLVAAAAPTTFINNLSPLLHNVSPPQMQLSALQKNLVLEGVIPFPSPALLAAFGIIRPSTSTLSSNSALLGEATTHSSNGHLYSAVAPVLSSNPVAPSFSSNTVVPSSPSNQQIHPGNSFPNRTRSNNDRVSSDDNINTSSSVNDTSNTNTSSNVHGNIGGINGANGSAGIYGSAIGRTIGTTGYGYYATAITHDFNKRISSDPYGEAHDDHHQLFGIGWDDDMDTYVEDDDDGNQDVEMFAFNDEHRPSYRSSHLCNSADDESGDGSSSGDGDQIYSDGSTNSGTSSSNDGGGDDENERKYNERNSGDNDGYGHNNNSNDGDSADIGKRGDCDIGKRGDNDIGRRGEHNFVTRREQQHSLDHINIAPMELLSAYRLKSSRFQSSRGKMYSDPFSTSQHHTKSKIIASLNGKKTHAAANQLYPATIVAQPTNVESTVAQPNLRSTVAQPSTFTIVAQPNPDTCVAPGQALHWETLEEQKFGPWLQSMQQMVRGRIVAP